MILIVKKMFKIKKEGELILGNKFQILSLEDNQENGMQANGSNTDK